MKPSGIHRTAKLAPRANAEVELKASTLSFDDRAFECVVIRLDVQANTLTAAAEILSDDERLRADRFLRDRDRERFIVARAGLRRCLAQRLGIQSDSVELTYGAFGKPALKSSCRTTDDLRFNVSHSGDIAAFAFSRGCEVGIDVEMVREVRDLDGVAAHSFSAAEYDSFRKLSRPDKRVGFFNCWTRKEAFIKATGRGFHEPLDEFDVTLAPTEPVRLLKVANTPGDKCGWKMFGFVPAPGYIGAVVVESPRVECASNAFSTSRGNASARGSRIAGHRTRRRHPVGQPRSFNQRFC